MESLPYSLHRGIDGVLDGLGTVQTVDLGLILQLDAVIGYGDGVALGFCSHDTGTFRTTFILGLLLLLPGGSLLLFLTVLLLSGLPSFLILSGLLGKGTGLQLGFRHLHLPIETDVIAVGQIDVLVVVAVPVLSQDRGNLVLIQLVLERFGVGDIVVVGDTAVLRDLLVGCIEEEMQVILVASV